MFGFLFLKGGRWQGHALFILSKACVIFRAQGSQSLVTVEVQTHHDFKNLLKIHFAVSWGIDILTINISMHRRDDHFLFKVGGGNSKEILGRSQ